LLNEEKKIPTEKDDLQLESEWVSISQLTNIRLLPEVVGDNILKIINNDAPLFLGSEHIPFNHG